MTDAELLAGYVEVWWQAVDDFTALLEEIPEEQWDAPTDLPGWDVRAVVAHVAHLEKVLATGVEEQAEIGEPAHVTGAMGLYTEIGPANRRGATPDDLIREIRESATARHTALLADPPTDASARPERVFGGVPWDWRTLLRNRPLDVWMHEQDVRRAVGRPGGLDSPAAQHTTDYLLESLGFVLAKRVGAPAGTTLLAEVDGSEPVAFAINDSGRGERLADLPAEPTVRLRTDRESFLLLAGGRRAVAPGAVRVEGDERLGQLVVEALATTP
ncbi:maleylpyruvate isomerase family mycothiol-dependent enzyme [Nocardioides sp. zg-DK7169]|uniref:maleylpyruvate isomerase family mycothiol-dependent enzyme n=1 Tax=Nocardioides sp. zg-DK7169 TaxID=2736600 RepID=UPI001555B34E|nr:maleylpyruvate isomerase family mycothiol-dependent enzyme [Nocardioides sp. zg-DK7169]NPC97084.1 maleylpyruvate isomerase family mycothiol-dependent enzyme [Nocardioides sp. zg-DK7169]